MFIIITLLYAKLFVFLRRPDRIRGSYSSPSGSFQERRSRITSSTFKPLGVISNFFRKAPPIDYEKEKVLERRVSLNARPPIATGQSEQLDLMIQRSLSRGPPPAPNAAPAVSPTSEIPPWERVELPVFQIDGQKFGGTASNVSHSGSSTALWGNWKGLSGSAREGKKRPSTASSSPPMPFARKFGSGSSIEGQHFGSTRQSPPAIVAPQLETIPSFQDPLHVDPDSNPVPTVNHPQHFANRGSLSASHSDRYRTFSLTSDTPYQGGSLATTATAVGTDRRPSALSQDSRRSSNTQAGKRDPLFLLPSGEQTDEERAMGTDGVYRKDYEKNGATQSRLGMGETEGQGEGDGDWDLMQMLQQSAPPKSAQDRFAPQGETVELVEESMASYLNRKTALLMLWFPLGVSKV